MNDAPVFTSTGQALHVSFMMAVLPPTQRVSTQVLIESIREQLGKTERRIESTINVGGLTPLEFRGQCALVTAAARDHLTQPEYAAVRARFGHQRTKSEGVQELAEYCQAATGLENTLAVRALVWRRYHRGGQRGKDSFSLAKISSETGVSESALRTAQGFIARMGDALEARADSRLGEVFERTGLVAKACEGVAA